VIKGCFGEGPFSFHGEHYDISDYQGFPAAGPAAPPADLHRRRRAADAQPGRSRGEHRRPRAADPQGAAGRAEEPDLGGRGGEDRLGREAAGDRFDDLVFNVYPSGSPIVVTDDLRGEARKIIDRLKSRTGIELTEQEAIDSPTCSSARSTGSSRSSGSSASGSVSARSSSAT
jgi:hypothetical protein